MANTGIGKLRALVIFGLVAGVVAWVATWHDEFTVTTEMSVARGAEEVYRLIADLRNHKKYHQYVPKETELLHSGTTDDGIEVRTFRTRELVPLPFGFHIPITFDATTKLTKPNRELVIELAVIGGTKGTSTWTLAANKGTAGAAVGTLVREEFTLECMWITCSFVEEKARTSHAELFRNMKNDLDGTGEV
ncbi:uncharacterized protein LOC110984851 [Acanthaster planci]|uniref:Uncharacterized protein LOC110984851 n=1 Tax=Acanthaster planci TaxID=133434 RepID=A0A8B7Z8H0_ACAPL|nr:uncharacterized protein LOC110984851 [Acanthaster planci]